MAETAHTSEAIDGGVVEIALQRDDDGHLVGVALAGVGQPLARVLELPFDPGDLGQIGLFRFQIKEVLVDYTVNQLRVSARRIVLAPL